MANTHEEEPPLDPVLENVRRKLVRRMAWSLGIMMFGLMAVLGAIVYKFTQLNSQNSRLADGEPLVIEAMASDGASVVSTEIDGERVLVHTKLPDGTHELLIIDLESGSVRAKISVR